MLHPDIQYQLCRMEQDQRIRHALRERQAREALQARRVAAATSPTSVRRLRNAVATALVSAFSLGGR